MTEPFIYDAGLLCLDFVNTQVVRDGRVVDQLAEPGGLSRWLDGAERAWAGTVPESTRHARRGPQWERRVLPMALELRHAVQGIADRLMAGEAPPRAAVALVNHMLEEVPVTVRLVPEDSGYRAVHRVTSRRPAAALAPVAQSTVELLTQLDWTRVGRCVHPDCVLYFYDATRNRSRRWCSMERCGNRSKTAAHYRRHRPTASRKGGGHPGPDEAP